MMLNKLMERQKTLQPEKAAKPELLGPQPGPSTNKISGAERKHNKRRRRKRNTSAESAEPTQIQDDPIEAGKEPTKENTITLTAHIKAQLTFKEVELKEFFKRLTKS
jgi:hypothetical protein